MAAGGARDWIRWGWESQARTFMSVSSVHCPATFCRKSLDLISTAAMPGALTWLAPREPSELWRRSRLDLDRARAGQGQLRGSRNGCDRARVRCASDAHDHLQTAAAAAAVGRAAARPRSATRPHAAAGIDMASSRPYRRLLPDDTRDYLEQAILPDLRHALVTANEVRPPNVIGFVAAGLTGRKPDGWRRPDEEPQTDVDAAFAAHFGTGAEEDGWYDPAARGALKSALHPTVRPPRACITL